MKERLKKINSITKLKDVLETRKCRIDAAENIKMSIPCIPLLPTASYLSNSLPVELVSDNPSPTP